MTLHILVTGPLRPSIDYVLQFGRELRRNFPDSRIHILYWKTTESDSTRLAEVYDTVIPHDEPSDESIYQLVPSRTIQQRQIGSSVDHFTPSIFKMYYGVKWCLDRLQLPPDSIVMRIRTDSYILQIDSNGINGLLRSIQPDTLYLCPRQTGGGVCDWFGIGHVGTLYKLYGHETISDFNQAVQSSYNAEGVLLHNARRYRIKFVDIRNCIRLAVYRGVNHPRFPEIHEYP